MRTTHVIRMDSIVIGFLSYGISVAWTFAGVQALMLEPHSSIARSASMNAALPAVTFAVLFSCYLEDWRHLRKFVSAYPCLVGILLAGHSLSTESVTKGILLSAVIFGCAGIITARRAWLRRTIEKSL
jgi:hypothetical protein